MTRPVETGEHTVEIVTIGNELLAGDVVDTNAARLAKELALHGLRVHRRQTVPDEHAAIRDALALAASRSRVVLVSGGLGPTTDDLTTEAVAQWMGAPLVLHEPSLAHIKARFASRGLPFKENNAKQAYFPEGAEVLPNALGTAPAFLVHHAAASLFFLPGVPRELVDLFAHEVTPRLLPLVPGGARPVWRTLRTFGMTESAVDAALGDLAQDEGLFIQYRAKFPEILVTPVVRDADPDAAGARLTAVVAAIRERLGDHVYTEGDAPLAAVVGDMLRRGGHSLAAAESCTGGLLSHLVTSVPGSSDYFLMGAVTYANAAKESLLGVRSDTLATCGAVSEEAAREMVAGIRAASGATVGVAITGIAGPGGGTAEKPVGTVHIAVSVGDRPVTHVVRRLPGDRGWVQTLSAWAGLDLIRRTLAG